MKLPRLIYPFLFALYPFLNVYASNIKLLPNASDLVVPSLLTVAVTCLVWGGSYLWTRNLDQAAGITLLLQFLFFSFGHFYDLLRDDLHVKWLTEQGLLVVWGILLILGLGLLWRWGKKLAPLAGSLNVMSLVLVGLPLLSIVFYDRPQLEAGRAEALPISSQAQGYDQLPDIYYIILDAFPNEKILQEFYNYDNTRFDKQLEAMGFYVARDSHTNFVVTLSSLATSLNMDFIQTSLGDQFDPQSTDLTLLHDLIQDNRLCRTLRPIGYYYIVYNSTIAPTSQSKCADMLRGYGQVNELTTILVQTTLLRPFVKAAVTQDLRRAKQFTFDDLPNVARLNEPTLTFAHMLLPHPPYLFDRQGNPPVDPPTGIRLYSGTALTAEAKPYYLDQTLYAGDQILKTLHAILENSEVPPLIILQSDHGAEPDVPWALTDTFLQERLPILNAYYFPQGGTRDLYPTISPVNSFRVLLNYYFDAQLPYLPDRSFYSYGWSREYYDLTEITP